jgi:SAM-dependent methyltransferase
MRSCPACEATLRPWRPAIAADPALAGRERFELARCPACGTAVTLDSPPPERAGALYEGGAYDTPARAADRLLEPLRRLADADRMRFLRGLPPGAPVLELGAGDGRLVAWMRAAGLEARGVEPSASARRRALARGVELSAEEPEPPAAGSDRAVVLWHVLEHLPDPAAALLGARRRLAPSGRLIVAVPNLASLQARIGGDRWFHQDVPRHRLHLTPAGITALLARCGFDRPRISHLLVEQNALGMWQTLLNRLTRGRNVAFRLLKRERVRDAAPLDLAVTGLAALPLALLAPIAELGAGIARRGGTIVAVSEPLGPGADAGAGAGG